MGVVVVLDASNLRIRLVSPVGIVTTLAGSGTVGTADGPGATASCGVFNISSGLAVVPSSGNVVVADSGNNNLRLITPFGVSTITTTARARQLVSQHRRASPCCAT